jgi:hypothetical protein
MWDVEYTDEFDAWWERLGESEHDAIEKAVGELMQSGPALRRPYVGTIVSSRHAHMKELRPPATSIRILFAFDPRRCAILLLGGDKRGQWERWYEQVIPLADDLYDEHLRTLRKEGLL